MRVLKKNYSKKLGLVNGKTAFSDHILMLTAGGFDARNIDGRFIRKRRAIAAIEPTKDNALIANFEGCSGGQLPVLRSLY